jgi:hypothetical protein
MAAVAPEIDGEFPRWRLAVAVGAALAFYAATMFDVATGREDWPISPYPMYSEMPGTTASRFRITGVSQEGEFTLDDAQTAPFHGSRLLVISRKLEHHPAKRAQFIRKLASRYEARRASEGWPELHAIRFYRDEWDLREYLKGNERPEQTLVSTMYLPPTTLLERLSAEANGKAAPEAPVRAPAGDVIVDFAPAQCTADCSAFADPLAAGGSALRLSPVSARRASAAASLELAAGRYVVLLRMRTTAEPGQDKLELDLDGDRQGELGDYREDLSDSGWVWASASSAKPPLALEVKQAGTHLLRLSSTADADVDELWLSRIARELPSDNRVREP